MKSNYNKKDDDIDKQRKELDAKAKVLLSHKDIIANILRDTVEEFKGYTIKEIMACLSGKPEVSTEVVDDVLTPRMDSAGTEAVSSNDGKRTYDIKFRITIPGTGEEAVLIINIESQYKYNPGYTLEKRGIYHICRMISSQYGVEFQKSEFDNIKKVYSIWICSHAPEEYANTITLYKFKPESIFGTIPDRREKYDMMSLIMICLGDNEDNGNKLLNMLNVLLKKFIEDGKPISKDFEKENELNLSDIYGEVNDMCNISEGIYNKGKTEGIAIGEARGRTEGIAIGEARGEARGKTEGIAIGEAQGETKAKEDVSANLREMGLTEEQIKQAIRKRN